MLYADKHAQTVIRCASIVQDFTTDQLLLLLRRLLDAPRTKAEEECMLLLCETLGSRAYESAVFQSITFLAEQLYERKQDWCDSLIASWAECFLPSGFLASPGVVFQKAAMDDMNTASPVLMDLARQIAEQGIRSEGSARVLAVAIYRSSSVWKAYSASTPILSSHPDSTRAVLAYLEVSYNSLEAKPSSTTLQAMTESAGAVLAGESSEDLHKNARQILLLIVKVDKTMASMVLSKIQTVLGQDAIQRPQLFNGANAAFLAALHGTIASFESFAALETFFNTALPWLVRRFAEDVQNDETIAAFITEFGKFIHAYFFVSHLP